MRERMQKIAGHFADRPEGNACREILLRFYGMKDDDDLGALGEERRKGPVAVDWPIETGASKEQLQGQREIMKRLRVWDEVRCRSSFCEFGFWLILFSGATSVGWRGPL